MKNISFALAALALSFNLSAEKVTEIRVVYDNPEQVPEHSWDTDLFNKTRQGFASHVEFLYWTVVEGGLSYAIRSNQPAWGDLSGPVGDFHNTDFGVDPGFRLALSFYRAPHYWEVWGQYTRMTSSGDREISIDPASTYTLDATWPTFTDTTAPADVRVVNAASSIHLNYNVADYLFDRVFQPNPHLRMRIVSGVTGVWFSQNQEITYTNSDASTNHVQNQWKYGGCGVRFGMVGDWYWFTDFYMTGKFTLAGVLGPYRNQNSQTTNHPPAGGGYDTALPVRDMNYTDTRSTTNLQLVIGPSYQKTFNKSRIEIFAGFEANIWTNLQEVYHSPLSSQNGAKEPWINSSDLSLFGLTSRLSIAY